MERLGGLPAEPVAADARRPESLAGAFAGIEVAFSCVGASVDPDPKKGREGFGTVDVEANRNLIAAAKAAGVRRFVYVSVFRARELRELAYMRAHDDVARLLEQSGLSFAVIRPTGFFSAMDGLVEMARRGALPLVGDGSARTNPIADADLAEVCADAMEGTIDSVDVGGPQVLSRREMAELAFRALDRPPKFRRVPRVIIAASGRLLRPFHPRLGELISFAATVFSRDLVAPSYGTRTLAESFRDRATSTS